MTYEKRKYRRLITEGPEPGQKTVSFELLALVHIVRITPQEAAILNAGRLESNGNTFFEYLVPEGGEDPQPFILTTANAGPGGAVDHKGKLLSAGFGARRIPISGNGNGGPRLHGRSGLK
ncbi:MAG: hypothetical protein HZA79_05035 [Sphingobacteriales bacterium]|nr:hypothetical protein [Sphingobacteriales bacterium]